MDIMEFFKYFLGIRYFLGWDVSKNIKKKSGGTLKINYIRPSHI